MEMDVNQIEGPKSKLQRSVLEPNVEMKFEIEDRINSEHGGDDKNVHHLEYQSVVDKIQKDVQSEDLKLVDCTEGQGNFDRPMEDLRNDNSPEDQLMDFEREIIEFHVKTRIAEVKLEVDEFIIKHESEEIENNLAPAEPERLECSTCCKTFKNIRYLRIHQHLHNDPSTIRIWKCNKCKFETIHKNGLKKHLVVHKDPSEIEMFHCTSCIYHSKRKKDLQRHMLMHQRNRQINCEDPPLISTPAKSDKCECSQCRKTFKNPGILKRHQFVHENLSSAKLWQCNECDYKTVRWNNFKDHLLVHKDPYETKVFQCAECNYGTWRKYDLGKHIRRQHRKCRVESNKTDTFVSPPTDPEEFECSMCNKIFSKDVYLKRHQLVHKDTKFKCDECSFETEHPDCLRVHLLLHENTSGTYRCDLCSYSSRVKKYVRSHLRKRHKLRTGLDQYIRFSQESAPTKIEPALHPNLLFHYEPRYKVFMDWRKENNLDSLSEEVVMSYMEKLAKEEEPSTVSTTYSMLKLMLKEKHDVDVSGYPKVREFVRLQAHGYKSKPFKVLTSRQIHKFLREASDEEYLFTKVVLLFGICGSCSPRKLKNLKAEDVADLGDELEVAVRESGPKQDRKFVIANIFYALCKEYMRLRPPREEQFFVNYLKGRCTTQPASTMTIGNQAKIIAAYLQLPNADAYTGMTFKCASDRIPADGHP